MMRRSKLLNPLAMLVAGLFLGVAARLMDIYCPLFGEIFSQMAVWICWERVGLSNILYSELVWRKPVERSQGEVI